MPTRLMTLDDAARYLHLDARQVAHLAAQHEIPSVPQGGRLVFRRSELDAWASQRILAMGDRHLREYHHGTSAGTRASCGLDLHVSDLLQPERIVAELTARTKAAVLRELVAVAEGAGLLYEPKDLLLSLEERERLCSTGMPGGIAFLHPRHPDLYLASESFLVLGRALRPLPFGAADGQPTDLFILMCCLDERLHLHALARLCLLRQVTSLLADLRAAASTEDMYAAFLAAEVQVASSRGEPLARERPTRV